MSHSMPDDQRLIEDFIDRSEPDTMSFDAFEQAAYRLSEEAIAETIELTGVVEGNSISFETTEKTPVQVRGNEVLIGGLRLVVKLKTAGSTAG